MTDSVKIALSCGNCRDIMNNRRRNAADISFAEASQVAFLLNYNRGPGPLTMRVKKGATAVHVIPRRLRSVRYYKQAA
jgi:hypothetical protein